MYFLSFLFYFQVCISLYSETLDEIIILFFFKAPKLFKQKLIIAAFFYYSFKFMCLLFKTLLIDRHFVSWISIKVFKTHLIGILYTLCISQSHGSPDRKACFPRPFFLKKKKKFQFTKIYFISNRHQLQVN